MSGIRDHRTARPDSMTRPTSLPRPGSMTRPNSLPRPGSMTRPTGMSAARPGEVDRPTPVARAKPDARPLRIAYGMAALAASTALVTALITPAGAAAGSASDVAQTTVTLPAEPAQPVKHVIQYVQLKPGQTAPPNAKVKVVPQPKPRVVVVKTRQSGAKP
jgi:hypothetical protein